jgi:hypothetical protein
LYLLNLTSEFFVSKALVGDLIQDGLKAGVVVAFPEGAGSPMNWKTALTLSLYLSTGSDLASTRYALRHGGYELNPAAGQQIGREAAFGASTAIVTHLVANRLESEHPRWSIALKVGFIAARGFATVNNVRIGRTDGKGQ